MVKILPEFPKPLLKHIEQRLEDEYTDMLVLIFQDVELPFRDDVLAEYGLEFIKYMDHPHHRFKKVVVRRITCG